MKHERILRVIYHGMIIKLPPSI